MGLRRGDALADRFPDLSVILDDAICARAQPAHHRLQRTEGAELTNQCANLVIALGCGQRAEVTFRDPAPCATERPQVPAKRGESDQGVDQGRQCADHEDQAKENKHRTQGAHARIVNAAQRLADVLGNILRG